MPENLNDVMRSATENLHPNIGKLTTGGIERGVRRRRTRRISQIAGAAASVTAVFGVVAMVGTPGHGGSAGVSAASGVPAAVTQSSAGAAPTTPAAAPAKPAAAPVSGDDMATWLEQALQPYHFTNEAVLYKAGTDDMAGPYATLRMSYAAGTGSLSLNVTRSAWTDQQGSGTVPYITEHTLKDGSHLMVFDGPEWPAGNGDPSAKRLDVGWYRTDGTLVDIMVLNEATEKGATTASGLGLTVEEATKVVQSPVWDKAIASVLAKPTPNAKTTPGGDKAKAGSGTDSGKVVVNPAAPTSR